MENNVIDVRIIDDKRNGLETASMVLGIIAIIGSWIPFLNISSIIMGFVGLGLGVTALVVYLTKKKGAIDKVIAGLVLCVLTLTIAFSVNILAINAINDTFDSIFGALNDTFGADDYSEAEYAYGETAELDGVSIRILSVEHSSGYTENFRTISPTNDSDEFVIVELEIKNTSGKTKSYRELNYSVQTSDGVIHSAGFPMYDTGNNLGSGQLAAKETKTGKIVLQAPKGDNDLILIYKSNMFSNKERKFKLQ